MGGVGKVVAKMGPLEMHSVKRRATYLMAFLGDRVVAQLPCGLLKAEKSCED